MKTNYIIPTIVLAFLLLSACKNTEQKGSVVNVTTSKEKLLTTTIENGNRLTKQSLLSYLPNKIGEYQKRGEGILKISEPNRRTGGVYQTLSQVYSNGNGGTITIRISDFADDQNHINEIQDGRVNLKSITSETVMQNSYKADNGWYITEMEWYRGSGKDKVTTSVDITVKNPRFSIFVKERPEHGTSASETATLLKIIQQSQLPSLFNLPIPQGEVVNKEIEDNRTVLDCDKILPESLVESICAKNVKVIVNDFEGEHNCNRSYKPDNGILGNMVFILTQYGSSTTAIKAVESKSIMMDEVKDIKGLGDKAALTTVGEDLYLSIAHKNYLIELRSFDEGGDDNLCPSLPELKRLANEVIKQL